MERTDGPAGTVVERFARVTGDPLHTGIGLVGSERGWRGHTWARTPTWYAAVNPTGLPGQATARQEGFTSRRAALTWLVSHG